MVVKAERIGEAQNTKLKPKKLSCGNVQFSSFMLQAPGQALAYRLKGCPIRWYRGNIVRQFQHMSFKTRFEDMDLRNHVSESGVEGSSAAWRGQASPGEASRKKMWKIRDQKRGEKYDS